MGKIMAASMPAIPVTLLVPVPLHPIRRRERGYDQAQILAQAVAKTLDLPCATQGLRRTRPTRQQATLDVGDRLTNVAGAFEGSSLVDGESILLIDDVLTTGATLESAAQSARMAGAESVVALVFASAY